MGNCGLVSISFRSRTTDDLISACERAGLKYIEWGSDVHCPVGDISYAKALGEKSRNAGLTTYCYGSYFRVGITDASEFDTYCLTAKALGAECIRVWAYNKQYPECTGEEIEAVERSTREIFDIAKKYNLCVNFEYHRCSLTETADGTLRLFESVGTDNLRVHWQPNPQITFEENLAELRSLPRVDIVHVFAWTYEDGKDVRHPLYNHRAIWKEYIDTAKGINPDCIFELEFFKNDDEEQFFADAVTLTDII